MARFNFDEAFKGVTFKAKQEMAEGVNICHFTDIRPYYKMNVETQEEKLKGFWLSTKEYADVFIRLFGEEEDLTNPDINYNLAAFFKQLEIEEITNAAIDAAKGKQIFCIREDKGDFTNYYFRQRKTK